MSRFYMDGHQLCTDDDDPTLKIHHVAELDGGRSVYAIESDNHPLRVIEAAYGETDITTRCANYAENSAWVFHKWPR